jgi:hypothetical protein
MSNAAQQNAEEDRSWSRVISKQKERRTVLTPMIHVRTIYPGYKHWVRFYRSDVYKKTDSGEDIYHWHLESHNFFDIEENRRETKEDRVYLAFTEPEYDIMIMDKVPRYAVDKNSKVGIRAVLNYARWHQIKFKPNSFIAKNAEQIEEALKHIKYCMVENIVQEVLQEVLPEDTISLSANGSRVDFGTPTQSDQFSQGTLSPSVPVNVSNTGSGIIPALPSSMGLLFETPNNKEKDEEEDENRLLHIIYPDKPPHQNMLDEIVAEKQQKQKLDLMSSSPLGCLESP